jgi:hypothetical protein
LQGRSTVAGGVAGKDAVEFSKKNAEMSRADKITMAPSSANQIRQIAGKTFYNLNGVWNDSQFKAEDKLPVVILKFASDEYFNMIRQEPKLAECFALGQNVVVVWKGNVYRVEE